MKTKSVAILGLAAFLFIPSVSMAADNIWTWSNAGKVVKKAAKRVVLPVTVVLAGAANAAEEYNKGGDAIDVVGAGLGGAGSKIGESVVETVKDIGTIGSTAVDVAGDLYKSATD
jgi:hypothetical protein